MKVFEEVIFEVPTADVEKRDFRIMFEMIMLTLSALATAVLTIIIFK